MTTAERIRIALRYTFPSGRGHLSTFLSTLSMLGLVLAIGLLIIVLSVMNGFDKEMRERILALVPHVTLHASEPSQDWREHRRRVAAHPAVREITPFTEFDALVIRGTDVDTVRGVGIDIADGAAPSRLIEFMGEDTVNVFRADPRALVLGAGVAQRLGVEPGASLTLVVPGMTRGDRARAARFETVKLIAILDTGTELDQSMALLHLSLASSIAGRSGQISGFHIATTNIFEVQRVAWELADLVPPGYYATNWMMTHGNLYAAIQLSRNLVSLLLLSIIAVAAFNVVSSLVLVVLDKQDDIAILRTLGASGRDIGWIFILQGAMIGAVGAVAGSLAGAAGSLAVPASVSWLERLIGVRFLNTDVYPVSFLPVDLLARDILLVASVALVMCVLAAIYPARRASALAPALVLNRDR
ncbi:MAG: FtsX-like permease family protein [Halioglobus sp.]|nr:FtsX-like permease family protein [Halioglobus sp.]